MFHRPPYDPTLKFHVSRAQDVILNLSTGVSAAGSLNAIMQKQNESAYLCVPLQ